MTTILQLPEEILLTIFEEFDDELDFMIFQYVCRAWYRPAHAMLLSEIALYSPEHIERFIASIDSNPDPQFLKAVKNITVYNTDFDISTSDKYRLSKETIAKLYNRFPCLQNVKFKGDLTILKDFDDDICKGLLEACPRLEKFEFEKEGTRDPAYYDILYKVRHLLTKLVVCDSKGAQRFGSMQNYIISFPRLREVRDRTGTLDSFLKFLPVVGQLHYLKRLGIRLREKDNINDSDTYIAGHPSIIDTLSHITHLDIIATRGVSCEAIDFVKKYLPGITNLHINSVNSSALWTDREQRLFCDNTLDLLLFVKNVAKFYFWIDLEALSSCLPTIIQKAFRPQPYTNKAKRILHIHLWTTRYDSPRGMVNLNMEVWRMKRLVKIGFNDKPRLDEITSSIFGQATPIQDVDCFILEIRDRGLQYCNDGDATTDMYCDMLGRMPSLKEVVLEIPLSFVETELAPEIYTELPNVERVTLRATANAKFQTLLDTFFYSFPKIKRLSFYYFCGIWKEDKGEFRLNLHRYKLETLVLDVTTVRKKMEGAFDKECFVLEIEFLRDSRRSTYIVSTKDLSFTRMTDMSGLYGFALGEDYYRVSVTINSLQELKLWTRKGGVPRDSNENYINCDSSSSTRNQVIIYHEDDKEN